MRAPRAVCAAALMRSHAALSLCSRPSTASSSSSPREYASAMRRSLGSSSTISMLSAAQKECTRSSPRSARLMATTQRRSSARTIATASTRSCRPKGVGSVTSTTRSQPRTASITGHEVPGGASIEDDIDAVVAGGRHRGPGRGHGFGLADREDSGHQRERRPPGSVTCRARPPRYHGPLRGWLSPDRAARRPRRNGTARGTRGPSNR